MVPTDDNNREGTKVGTRRASLISHKNLGGPAIENFISPQIGTMPPKPKRPPRFALFLMDDPPSAEVLSVNLFQRVRELAQVEVGQERSVVKGKGKQVVKGRILRLGIEKALKKLRVTSHGEVHEREEAGFVYLVKWYHAVNLLKKARERNLEAEDEALYLNGPEVLVQLAPPPAVRTPIKRPQSVLEELQSKLDTLQCRIQRSGDVQVNECSNVFMNGALLHYYLKSYKNTPERLFRKMLRALLPEEILKSDGFSLDGGGCTVGIPADLISAITAYVSLNCEEAAVGYDPQAIVRHYVYRCRDDQFKRRRTPSIPTLRAEPAAHQYDDGVVGFQTRPPPPQMVHPPPQMVHPPPQMVHPPPQMVHPPPQMVQPPPQMAHPPPQMAHPPPQTFQPPPPGVETTTLPQTLPSLSAIESLNISADFPNPLHGAQLPLSTVLGQHMQAGVIFGK